jgi:CheY-like chemotaxis protein
MDLVLIVEDDVDQLNLLMAGLRKHQDKFAIIPARDGKEAVTILKEESISLLVTDIQMPRLNGMILLAYVHTFHPEIPCFVITAYGTSRLQSKLGKADILRFFHKPIKIDDFAGAIIAALEKKHSKESRRGISLVNFLHMIEMEQTTCSFEVSSPGEPACRMYFENGILLDAECGDITGEAAALGIMGWKEVDYRFNAFPEKTVERRIKADIKDLIRNALGTVDEPIDDP